MKLNDWATKYFASAHHKRATTMARDQMVYATHIERSLGLLPLNRITPLDAQRFVDTMAKVLAPSTVRTNLGVLRAILNAAVDSDLLLTSPVRKAHLPRRTASRRPSCPSTSCSLLPQRHRRSTAR